MQKGKKKKHKRWFFGKERGWLLTRYCETPIDVEWTEKEWLWPVVEWENNRVFQNGWSIWIEKKWYAYMNLQTEGWV